MLILKLASEGDDSCPSMLGNPKCNPNTWTEYQDGCCSREEPCGVNEGDCNDDSECFGSLICSRSFCPDTRFHVRASCCAQPSGTLNQSK